VPEMFRMTESPRGDYHPLGLYGQNDAENRGAMSTSTLYITPRYIHPEQHALQGW
jgi:hypothetical protein